MTRRVLVMAPALMMLAAVPAGSVPAPGSGSNLTLAVLPCSNIETTFRKFYPLLTYLKGATGFSVTLMVPADLPEFETLIRNEQVDFALQDPHTFVQLARVFDRSNLLQTRALNGTTTQSGVVVVRRDSGVTDVAQLRGRTVMFGPRTSTPKWVAARTLFESSGIAVDRDVKVLNGGCCEDIAFAVSVRSVAAGVICDHFLTQHEARQKDLGVDPASLLVIARTAPFPTRVFAARKGVPAETAKAIARALLRLDPAVPEQARILSSAEIRGFLRVTEAEYLAEVGRSAPRVRR